jgi:hypothetical protein
MINRELIKLLLDEPMEAIIYVGKGMGPAKSISTVGKNGDAVIVAVISPESKG